jgi:hypothetical protein
MCLPLANPCGSVATVQHKHMQHKAGSTFHWKSEAESTAGTKVQM